MRNFPKLSMSNVHVQKPRTWKHSFNVPGHEGVEHRIEEHERDGRGEIVAVLLHGAGEQVTPLDAHTLLLEQSKVLTAEAERHRREEALRKERRRRSTHDGKHLQTAKVRGVTNE